MTRAEINRRYYDKKLRRTHAGKLAPLCHQRGPIGDTVTCKTCLKVMRAQSIGKSLNEWEQKRIAALVRTYNAERAARWRKANPDKVRAMVKRYREKYRDLYRLSCRAYYAKNRDQRREYNRSYYLKRKATHAHP